MLERVKCHRLSVAAIALGIVTIGSDAFAFDPFTVMTAVGTVKGLIGGGDTSLIEDVSNLGFSFSGLLDDLDVDTSGSDELKREMEKLEVLNHKIRAARDAGDDLMAETQDLSEAEKLQSKIETIRSMIRTSKVLAALVIAKPKASEHAFQIQSTRLQYMQLDEMAKLNRASELRLMKEEAKTNNLRLVLSEIAREERRRR